MKDDETTVDLDEEILEAALTILDEGTRPSVEDLLPRFPGREAAIECALDALKSYQRQVAEQREPADPLSGDDILVPGTRLGDFVIESWLGGGGMGGVYRARWSSEGDREVALKVLSPAAVENDPRALARFEREAEQAACVDHDGFAEIYTTGSDRGHFFIAMRLVEGRTLHDVLLGLVHRRRFEETAHENRRYVRRIARLVRCVADSLAAIHAMGLVHRDVKPSNIILEGASDGDDLAALDAQPVLVDYGLLRPIESFEGVEITGDQTVVGTAAFVSPEAWLGREVDARADVFSLGAVLHDLLSLTRPGKRPMASAGLSDLMPLNSAVDRRLAAIVAMSLEDRVSVRYRNGGAFRDDLDRYLAERTLRALPLNPLRRLALRYRRSPVRTAMTVVAVLLFVVLVAGLGYFGAAIKKGYDAASSAEEFEVTGDVVGAEAQYRVLSESSLAPYLPGLGDDLERARSYLGDEAFAEVCASLGSEDEGAFAAAHVKLQRFLLTPGHEEWHPLLMRFLVLELRGEELRRRRFAAETVSIYRMIRPLPYGGGAISELESVLLEIAGDRDRDDVDLPLLRHVFSSLSGMGSHDAFDALIDLLGSEDPELSRIAIHSTSRLWHRARLDGQLPELPPPLIRDWVRALGRITITDEGVTSQANAYWFDQTLCFAAWTRLERERVGTRGEREDLSPKVIALLGEFEGALSRFEEGALIPRVVGYADPNGPLAYDEPLERRRWCQENLRGPKTPYEYLNLWNDEDPSLGDESGAVTGDLPPRKEVDSLGNEWTTTLARLSFPDAKLDPCLEGDALRVRWEGGTHRTEGFRPPVRFFQFVRPGESNLRLTAAAPPVVSDAKVTLQHCYASRGFLPSCGRALVRVTVGEEGATHTFAVSLGRREVHFYVDEHVLAGKEELDVLVELLSATTTYRIYSLEVEFRRLL
jgi:serine/threonine protein kinase